MPFAIYIEHKKFTIKGFIEANFDELHLRPIQLFLETWIKNGDFFFKSSGSTGVPKEFRFSKDSLVISAHATINALHLVKEQEHVLLCLDAQFIGGAMMVARALILDCSLTIFKPGSKVFNELSSVHPFTFASFVPIQLMDESFSTEKYKRFKNVLIGGSSLSLSLSKEIGGQEVNSYQSYGMTETLSHVALKNLKNGKGYRPIAPYKIRINECHQLCIKAPYLEDELITNDLAEWVDENHFEWLGRLDFVINSGGVKIYPEEMERVIVETGILPKDCQIILSSLPHQKWGRELMLIVSKPITQKMFEELKIGLNQRGFNYKVPKRFIHLSPFPLLDSGKVSRRKINEWLENQ